jgi:protein tyrosine/serine phosphatase
MLIGFTAKELIKNKGEILKLKKINIYITNFIILAVSILGLQPAALANESEQTCIETAGAKITNFHVVLPGKIYRGARLQNSAPVALLKNNCGIKRIINLQGGDPSWFRPWEPGENPDTIANEKSWATDEGLEFTNLPLNSYDAINGKQEALIEKAVQELVLAQSGPNSQPVFIHCEHGKDRTGLVVALFQVLYNNMSVEDAHQQMMEYGHSDLLKELDRYFYRATTPPMGLTKVRDSE